ncbi:uncharacterized protein LOC119458012 [Dermacentor silvarum]|uniref:uncharacterized protein LOC119458012 n=1 Tax=Dermacentor silvarum TaxID=543639 RepID=UPI00189A7113|nr:uncharacterized protein LOC119458012 [Dermacentor silvarum]
MTLSYISIVLLGYFACMATSQKGYQVPHSLQQDWPIHHQQYPHHPYFHRACESTECPEGYKICCLIIGHKCGCKCVPIFHHCSYAWEDECPVPHRPNCAHTDAENLCHCDFGGFYAVLGISK